MKQRLFIIVLSLIIAIMEAQPNMERDSSITVNMGSGNLKFPWAGGINFSNWGMIDLNSDGFKDLVVYDKSGGKIRTFINDGLSGQASFTHNSAYQNNWPQLYAWMTLHDYNCDGKEDIFTYANNAGGILVYKNISTPGNFQFTPVGHYDSGLNMYYLISDYSPVGVTGPPLNIPVTQVSLPGLSDLDGDGDMDVIVFNAQGYQIEYHQNQSVDLGYGCDSLVFKVIDNCWGDISESSCVVNKFVCPYPKIVQSIAQAAKNNHHAGSCIMCFDADGDNLKDVLMGDIVCDSVIYLHNGGVINNAHIDNNTMLYPPSKPIGMSIYPCTYYLDINNDAKRDLIATPALQGSENVNNVWMYTNSNADNNPVLNYVQNNFIQQSMIDLGEGAYPTMFDYEGDGDLDLLVGNFGYYGTPYVSKIALFKNVGTSIAPAFSLTTNDFAGLSSMAILNLAPATGDLDGDGDVDLLVGDNTGRFSFFPNTAGVGNPAVYSSTPTSNYGNGFLAGMDVGTRSYPQLVDMDRDGKLDIISGNQTGRVYYYHNTGTTTAPTFSLVSTTFGGVNVLQNLCSSIGQAMPFVFNDNGSYKMLVGSECGSLYLYDNIDGNLGGTFTLVSSNAFGVWEGEHTAPCLYDLNGDNRLDLLIGNYSGGLDFFRGLNTNYGIKEDVHVPSFELYPNPTSAVVTLNFSSFDFVEKQVSLLDISGRVVLEIGMNENTLSFDAAKLANGVYFIRVRYGRSKNVLVKKLVVQHD